MDLNSLYSQHQLSLMQAVATSSRLLRTRHLAAAGALANRIQIYQTAKGAAAARGWLHDSENPERPAYLLAGISI